MFLYRICVVVVSEIHKTSMSKKVCVMYGMWTEYSLSIKFEVSIMNTSNILLLLLLLPFLFLLLKHHNLLWNLASNTVFLHSSETIVYLCFLLPLCLNLQTCPSVSYVVFLFSLFLQTSFTHLETVLLFNSFIFQYVKFMSKRSWYQSKNRIFTANRCWCTETVLWLLTLRYLTSVLWHKAVGCLQEHTLQFQILLVGI